MSLSSTGLRNAIRNAIFATATAAALNALSATPAQAQTAFALTNGGSTLISFPVANPGAATTVANFTVGGAAATLDAIDFRPLTKELYGYSDATDTLYKVNTLNGTLTVVASGSGASATNSNRLGLDFNPTIDRVRVVTETRQNFVYNPNNANPPLVATNLFYAVGDINEQAIPAIVENAYTNNFAGAATSVQYGIDYRLDTLVTIANNAGTLVTVGSLGVDINDTFASAGFDILSPLGVAGSNIAYAILDTTVGTAPTFYTINLGTGAATPIGGIGGNFTGVYSLAVSNAAPEPTSGILLLLTLSGASVLHHRRRRA